MKRYTIFWKIRESIYKLQEKFEKLEKQVFEKIQKLKEKATDLFTSAEKEQLNTHN
ncbi:hypothetical protein SHM_12740 [Spiroplasma ixodetis]|uniref:Uncharacterized protein n=1 Tax=Spiroplasma ixodetis TaxID=2141 RepID=A0ABM8BUW5_9MOLU|nr:hypothetical protein SHM_12740 [Spiroplasma ixodetis]